jgi:hypothetical protein
MYIYVTSTIEIFGEMGKKLVSLLAEENAKVEEMCLQVLSKDNQEVG